MRPKGSGSGRKGKEIASMEKLQGGGKSKRSWFWCLVKDYGGKPIWRVDQHLVKVHKLDPKTVALLLKKMVRALNWAVPNKMPNPSLQSSEIQPLYALLSPTEDALSEAVALQPTVAKKMVLTDVAEKFHSSGSFL